MSSWWSSSAARSADSYTLSSAFVAVLVRGLRLLLVVDLLLGDPLLLSALSLLLVGLLQVGVEIKTHLPRVEAFLAMSAPRYFCGLSSVAPAMYHVGGLLFPVFWLCSSFSAAMTASSKVAAFSTTSIFSSRFGISE